MIKVAIQSLTDIDPEVLLPLLYRHPEVEIVHISDRLLMGQPADALAGSLTGELDMVTAEHPDLDGADVLFTSLGATRALLARRDAKDDLRIIVMDPQADTDPEAVIYGLPELNRKAMVRGGRLALNPSPLATATLLALLPLAKNLLLRDSIEVNGVMGEGPGYAPQGRTQTIGTQTALTVTRALQQLQTSCEVMPRYNIFTVAAQPMLLLTVTTPCSLDNETLANLYTEFYKDHNFCHMTRRPPQACDVTGTNKCLYHTDSDGSRATITVAIDPRIKGASGNAVHIMNLMFGLHECTGLH